MLRLLIFLIPLLFTISCRSQAEKDAKPIDVQTPVAENTEVPEDAAPQREPAQPDTFRVVISLISIGEGTDPEGTTKIEAFLQKYQRTKKLDPIHYTVQPWGREGEADYNFMLRGMDEQQQADFVDQLTQFMNGEKLIRVTENKENRFKR